MLCRIRASRDQVVLRSNYHERFKCHVRLIYLIRVYLALCSYMAIPLHIIHFHAHSCIALLDMSHVLLVHIRPCTYINVRTGSHDNKTRTINNMFFTCARNRTSSYRDIYNIYSFNHRVSTFTPN